MHPYQDAIGTLRVSRGLKGLSTDFAFALTKADLLDQISAGTGLTKIEVEAVISGFMIVVSKALQRGESVDLRGFGSFKVQKRAPRKSRNPATNETVHIEARHVPVFRPSRDLRNAVQESLSE